MRSLPIRSANPKGRRPERKNLYAPPTHKDFLVPTSAPAGRPCWPFRPPIAYLPRVTSLLWYSNGRATHYPVTTPCSLVRRVRPRRMLERLEQHGRHQRRHRATARSAPRATRTDGDDDGRHGHDHARGILRRRRGRLFIARARGSHREWRGRAARVARDDQRSLRSAGRSESGARGEQRRARDVRRPRAPHLHRRHHDVSRQPHAHSLERSAGDRRRAQHYVENVGTTGGGEAGTARRATQVGRAVRAAALTATITVASPFPCAPTG